ncbi:MAG TPA: hypothetical protein VGY55_07960 [Pirellulales bacterium]|nr:hypothetical protein [Pirellulales bacterium]
MSGVLPHWLESYFGVETGAAGEGTIWRLDDSWTWNPSITILFVLLVIVLVVAVYKSEIGSAGRLLRGLLIMLRLTAIGLVLGMIAQWILKLNPTQLPYLVVLVDDSESMRINDHYANEKFRADIERRVKQLGLDGVTRLNQAKTLLLENDAALLKGFDKRYKLKVFFCSELARPQSNDFAELRKAIRGLEPTGKATRLGDNLRAVLSDQGLTGIAAVVLLTDGVTTDGERLLGQSAASSADQPAVAEGGAADFARLKGVPLFTIGLGSDEPTKDVELSDLRVPEVTFVDDILAFKFNLSASGFAGRDIEVRLKDKKSGAVLAKQIVKIAADAKPQEMTLTFRPDKIGDYDFVVETDSLPDEVRFDNNRLERQVSVRQAQIRVLMVQAYPSYEFRYLKNLLERDNTIEVHTVLQDADVDYTSEDKTALPVFPVRREDLFAYDAVIFGDVNPALLSNAAMSSLSEFVLQKGGGLVFIAGPSYDPMALRGTPLANLLPIDLATVVVPDSRQPIADGFVVQPTADGLNYPNMQLGDTPAETRQIWQTLPPVYWLLEAQKKETAEVLAEHPTLRTADGRKAPVILQRRTGAGMVLFHATDETWRWRFQVGDVYFARYWIQTIRYLSRTKLLGKDQAARLASNRKEYARGEPIRLRLEFTDERLSPPEDRGAVAMLRRGDQPERQITLHRNPTHREVFDATLVELPQGDYHAWVIDPVLPGEPSTSFLVKVSEAEFERTQMDLTELEGAAAKTKGRFYRIDTAAKLLDDLPSGRHVPMKPTNPPVELWNQWPVLLVLLLALAIEWMLRKRSGML